MVENSDFLLFDISEIVFHHSIESVKLYLEHESVQILLEKDGKFSCVL